MINYDKKNENELVQYYIVNKDLINNYNMSVGKIAAQVGHAARLIALRD
jgi:peptidyl-tRNA hydrolase